MRGCAREVVPCLIVTSFLLKAIVIGAISAIHGSSPQEGSPRSNGPYTGHDTEYSSAVKILVCCFIGASYVFDIAALAFFLKGTEREVLGELTWSQILSGASIAMSLAALIPIAVEMPYPCGESNYENRNKTYLKQSSCYDGAYVGLYITCATLVVLFGICACGCITNFHMKSKTLRTPENSVNNNGNSTTALMAPQGGQILSQLGPAARAGDHVNRQEVADVVVDVITPDGKITRHIEQMTPGQLSMMFPTQTTNSSFSAAVAAEASKHNNNNNSNNVNNMKPPAVINHTIPDHDATRVTYFQSARTHQGDGSSNAVSQTAGASAADDVEESEFV